MKDCNLLNIQTPDDPLQEALCVNMTLHQLILS